MLLVDEFKDCSVWLDDTVLLAMAVVVVGIHVLLGVVGRGEGRCWRGLIRLWVAAERGRG